MAAFTWYSLPDLILILATLPYSSIIYFSCLVLVPSLFVTNMFSFCYSFLFHNLLNYMHNIVFLAFLLFCYVSCSLYYISCFLDLLCPILSYIFLLSTLLYFVCPQLLFMTHPLLCSISWHTFLQVYTYLVCFFLFFLLYHTLLLYHVILFHLSILFSVWYKYFAVFVAMFNFVVSRPTCIALCSFFLPVRIGTFFPVISFVSISVSSFVL